MAALFYAENKRPVSMQENPMKYYLYPPPIAQYEDVIASPILFMDIFGKFHAAMGTKFKIPIVGGKDLDLHRLFMEVTSRGGIKRIYQEKAVKDKERYKSEMENYLEGIKKEQVLTTSMPPAQQQQFMMNTDIQNNGVNSYLIHENEPNSEYCDDDDSSFEGDVEETTGKVSNFEMGAENFDSEQHKMSFNTEDGHAGQKKTTSVDENEPLSLVSELTRIQENDSKQDAKSPDFNVENKTKGVYNEDQDLELFDENGS